MNRRNFVHRIIAGALGIVGLGGAARASNNQQILFSYEFIQPDGTIDFVSFTNNKDQEKFLREWGVSDMFRNIAPHPKHGLLKSVTWRSMD